MKDKKLIIYHDADYDGKCSAAIALYKYSDADLYGFDHYREIDWELIKKYDTVIMVDISFPKDDMKILNDIVKLVWIDHHKTSIDDLKDLKINGVQKIGIGACQLCWEYFFPEEGVPYSVRLLALWDVWIHKNKDVIYFQYGLRLKNLKAKDQQWKSLFIDHIFSKDSSVNLIIDLGKKCYDYQKSTDENKVKTAFEISFEGYDCIAINSTFDGSMVFKSLEKDYDIMIVFGFSGEKWKVSLYSDNNVDVGSIAKKYSGGGHFSASGFKCSTEKMMQLKLIK